MLINYWKKHKKNMDFWDVSLIKLTMVALAFFIITIWPAAMSWVSSVNPWYFFIVFVVTGASPFYWYFIK